MRKSINIDEMDGHEFEYFCAELLRKNGFSNVVVTRGSGDYGIDILAKRDGKAYAIQCKRFSGKVSNKAVQEALSGKVFYNCDIAVVLTNSFFTDNAIETAKRTNVLLWDRNKLIDMAKTAFSSSISFSFTEQNKEDAGISGDGWLGLEDKNFFTAPSFPQQKNRKIIWTPPNRPRFKIGCLGVVLIFFAIIYIIVFLGEKAETKKIEEKKNKIVSAINKDETPTATTNPATDNPEDNSKTVIVNGICYENKGDHFEVVGLSDFKMTNIIIQESIDGIPVTTIQERAFAEEEGITRVSLPQSITDIQSGAFSTCRKLTSINLPNGITKISSSTFILCQSLQSIRIPDTVTEIESSAFSGTALTSISIKNVIIIENNAFSHTNLKSVSLSPCLIEIGDRAFEGCHSLVSISIPEGVEKIGKECFSSCEKLKSISLPETLTTIGKRCFWGCRALSEIRIPPNVKKLRDDQMFESCLALEVIYIPADCEIPSGREPFSGCNRPRIVFY